MSIRSCHLAVWPTTKYNRSLMIADFTRVCVTWRTSLLLRGGAAKKTVLFLVLQRNSRLNSLRRKFTLELLTHRATETCRNNGFVVLRSILYWIWIIIIWVSKYMLLTSYWPCFSDVSRFQSTTIIEYKRNISFRLSFLLSIRNKKSV